MAMLLRAVTQNVTCGACGNPHTLRYEIWETPAGPLVTRYFCPNSEKPVYGFLR